MVRPAVRFRPLLLIGSLLLATACTGDEDGVRRLPLEPDASLGLLTVSPKASNLWWIGATSRLTAQITGGDGVPAKGFTYTWRSLDTGVVTVDGAGNLTAITEGTARIVATTANLADTATVNVERTPATITVSKDSLLFTLVGAQAALTTTVKDGGGATLGTTVTWSSSDTAVATVTQSGAVMAKGQGRANLTAQVGGVSRIVKVRVSVGPSSVSVTPAGVAFDALGDSAQLVATVKDAAGSPITGVAVTYTVSDTTVASVSATGMVRSKKVGSTQVVAKADSVSRVVAVTVTQKITSVTVTPDSATLIPGGTAQLAAVAADRNGNPVASAIVAWASGDTAVATVNSTGLVTGKSTGGTATISATSSGVVGTSAITVVDVPVASVEVEPSALSLAQGATANLTVTFRSAEGVVLTGPTVTWTSDDAAVANVGFQGKVTAIDVGSTWIRATVNDSVAATDSAAVTVTSTAGAYDIEVRYLGVTPTSAQQAAFAAAEARWEEIIVGDQADGAVNQTSICGLAGADLNETVDDLVIFAKVDSIDGAGGVLGQAGPCLVRSANGLAAVGMMEFDEADLASLEASGDLGNVIIHEMGHVLGFGSSTPWNDVLVDKGAADPYWPGTGAVAQYDLAGGAATNKVPVANTGGEGTRDAHWREAHMGAELLTGYLNSGVANPLSAISIGAMGDMGYAVDLAVADAYTVSAALRAQGTLIELREMAPPTPYVITPQGRIVGPIRLR